MQHAYFPTTAIVSLHYVMESGASAETAGVGNEGVVGISLFMGGDTTPSSAVVQTAGHAYRLESRRLKEEFKRGGLMQHLLLRYTQALITQMTQTAVCNRHHSVEQQLCRWLLLTLDRVSSRELVMTQELVASMLGVRREGITEAAGKLQHAGFISYRRGHISVLERAGLETPRVRVLRRGQEGTGPPAVRRPSPPGHSCVVSWSKRMYAVLAASLRIGFGAAGSLVALLLWVYYSAQIFFLGAEFTRQYALRFGSLKQRRGPWHLFS